MIYEEGCDAYPTGYLGAWIKMSAPLAHGETQHQVYVFRGLPAPTKEAAKKKAAEAAVYQLCNRHNIAINYHNYNALKTMYRSCSAAQEWSKIKEEELQIQTRQKAILQRDKSR